eukprot:TRINITY_DN29349_c0_g1_i1.p1 TRINITY_DN29349_c0_g1~~TRINITY_DN29349_c0_g1_i1.p1  ORF type:complete len:510 (-),score=51.57 TRINITY_DN29349_c0_g1_i1:214-1743(-)
MMLSLLSVAASMMPAFAVCTGGLCAEQRHLSYGQTHESMVAMWVTPEKVHQPMCSFALSSEGLPTSGYMVKAATTKICQIRGISEFSHTCEMTALMPGQYYFYTVGDKASGTWSEVAKFRARPDTSDWSPTMLVYGDLGAENAVSLPAMQADTEAGEYDFVLHVGDLAYDLNSGNGTVGRAFMRSIEPIASRLPYMTVIGNHEGGTDFDHVSSLYHYMHRFQMPGQGDLVHGRKGNNVYYSFDAGPAHVVAFSSEVYMWQLWDVAQQFEFLKRDLASVDRSKTPWVLVMAHRPMYCSNKDGDDCTKLHANLREGLPVLGGRFFALEPLFQEHHVDLALWAHEHSYERTWPVYNHTVMNGTEAPYINPGAPVHIIAGAPGCKEQHDHFEGPRGDWSALRSEEYGYGKLQVLNKTHLSWQQFTSSNHTVIDEIMIVKTQMTSFEPSKLATATQFQEFSAQEIETQQQLRESIFAQTRGCMERGSLPEYGCRTNLSGSSLTHLSLSPSIVAV